MVAFNRTSCSKHIGCLVISTLGQTRPPCSRDHLPPENCGLHKHAFPAAKNADSPTRIWPRLHIWWQLQQASRIKISNGATWLSFYIGWFKPNATFFIFLLLVFFLSFKALNFKRRSVMLRTLQLLSLWSCWEVSKVKKFHEFIEVRKGLLCSSPSVWSRFCSNLHLLLINTFKKIRVTLPG